MSTFTIQHTVENGIERICYTPDQPRHQTPILMLHGMWHGAWCWQHWQELFAEWGWQSIAFSLPGHGQSPVQRPIRLCTLDYYLRFLKAEVERLPIPPILMGHSMGGALTQWYWKHVRSDLAAFVLVAPWASHNSLVDGIPRFVGLDPLGALLQGLTFSATPYVRNPQRAAAALISTGAIYTPEELYARLGAESMLVMLQHNPPFWSPVKKVNAPVLWLGAEKDAVIGEAVERRSAAHYGADYRMIPNAAHNLMMEHNYRETAAEVNGWLQQQHIH